MRGKTAAVVSGVAVALGAVLSGCMGPDLTSGLGIPAGETFNLGGEQEGGYRAQVSNQGDTEVTLMSTTSTGLTESLGTIAPGEKQRYEVRPGRPLLLRNESDQSDASLLVKVYGESNLAMYYTPNDEEETD
ncbi:MAG: hypothetical protein AAGI53_16140 [Planctomycetota bacterium]